MVEVPEYPMNMRNAVDVGALALSCPRDDEMELVVCTVEAGNVICIAFFTFAPASRSTISTFSEEIGQLRI